MTVTPEIAAQLYETDFVAWTKQTVQLIRAEQFGQVNIDEQRNRIADLLQESPSLKPYLEEVLAECYRRSRKAATNETELLLNTFPVECPYPMIQVLDPEFLPEVID